MVRTVVLLACAECQRRNYRTTKNKQTKPGRFEMQKYCSHCKKHTLHRETK